LAGRVRRTHRLDVRHGSLSWHVRGELPRGPVVLPRRGSAASQAGADWNHVCRAFYYETPADVNRRSAARCCAGRDHSGFTLTARADHTRHL